MPARSRLSFDGQHDFNGEEDWELHLKDAPISELDMTITPQDCVIWRAMHEELKQELYQYHIGERQRLLPNEEAQRVTKPITIPLFNMTLDTLVGKTLSLALHRCASLLDAHYDIAAMQEKKAKSEVHRVFWRYKRQLAHQLRDDICSDIEHRLRKKHTKSGMIDPPLVGGSRDDESDDTDAPDYTGTSIPVAGLCPDSLVTASAGGQGNAGTSVVQGSAPSQRVLSVNHIITEETANMLDTEYLNGSITDVSHGTLKPSCAITPDQGHSLVSKGQPVTPSIAEVDVRHDHVTVPVQYCTVTRVHDSFDKAKIELSTIQDVKLRRKFNEPTLQLPAKFEALDRTADEVRANQLAEISLYCQHHDIDAEKWSHIPKPPFQTSDGHESLTSDDPPGVVHDDVIGSTDFIRITSPELKIAPKPPVLGCAYVESTPEVATYVHHHHPGDRIFISAPSIPIWTDANDIAVGGERVEDSYLDSRFGHIIAGGATTMETSEHALVDSGCGKSTIPTGGKFTCNQRDYRSDESRYRIQAAQGDAVAATGIADWVVCWSSDTRDGWVLKCMVIKALVNPNSVFYMIATGTEGLGYKGSPLSFVDNANSTGTPAIWQSNTKQYEWSMRK